MAGRELNATAPKRMREWALDNAEVRLLMLEQAIDPASPSHVLAHISNQPGLTALARTLDHVERCSKVDLPWV